jgi:hypothetical protein
VKIISKHWLSRAVATSAKSTLRNSNTKYFLDVTLLFLLQKAFIPHKGKKETWHKIKQQNIRFMTHI